MFRKASKSLTTSEEAYEYALTLLDRREYAAVDLEERLRRRGAAEDLIRETVDRLRRNGLINEERYARRVLEAWRHKKYYGRLHLQAELKKKNVEPRYVSLFLDEFSEEEEENGPWRHTGRPGTAGTAGTTARRKRSRRPGPVSDGARFRKFPDPGGLEPGPAGHGSRRQTRCPSAGLTEDRGQEWPPSLKAIVVDF